jgi:hypothetical protein
MSAEVLTTRSHAIGDKDVTPQETLAFLDPNAPPRDMSSDKELTYQAVLLPLIADSDSVAPNLKRCWISNDPFFEEGWVGMTSQRRVNGGARQ